MKRIETANFKIEGTGPYRVGVRTFDTVREANAFIGDYECRAHMGYFILETNDIWELRGQNRKGFLIFLPSGESIREFNDSRSARYFFYNNCLDGDDKYSYYTLKRIEGEVVECGGVFLSVEDALSRGWAKIDGVWYQPGGWGTYHGQKYSLNWLRETGKLYCSMEQSWFDRDECSLLFDGECASAEWLKINRYWRCTGNGLWYSPSHNQYAVDGQAYSADYCTVNFYPTPSGGWSRTPVRPDFSELRLPNEVSDVLYGLEVEMEQPRNDENKKITPAHPFVSYKPDGSLKFGIEMVTRPFTWGYWTEKGKEELAGILKLLKEAGCAAHSTTTAGLHIHVDKRAWLNPWHVAKSLRFLHVNADLAFELSERCATQMNQWSTPKLDYKLSDVAKNALKVGSKPTYGRYRALNTTPQWTNEFRMFRGNLAIDGIQRALETVRAIIDFTRDAGYNDLTRSQFLRFVKNKQYDYRTLVYWLEEKNMLPKATNKKSERNLILCA